MDNPQYFYGKNKEYCEHFEAIELIKKLFVKKRSYLIFNINKKPFNYKKLKNWRKKEMNIMALTLEKSLQEKL